MKILKLSIILCSLFVLFACQEEKHAPLFSGGAPSPVSHYDIENLPGAAAISFKLDDPNTAYVKAVYTIEHGVTRTTRVSKFDNKLLVDGFAESKEYSIAIYAVGKDEQESEPIHITIHPQTPPYKQVVADIKVEADWGGGKITGINPTKALLLIGVVKKDPVTGRWVDVVARAGVKDVMQVFFTEGQDIKFNFRGQAPLETEFGIYTRDRWQNFSDTVSFTFEPWEEIQLPISHQNPAHFSVNLPGDAGPTSTTYPKSRIFDGLKATWTDGYYSIANNDWPKTVTIDLLKPYQLSRFKYWQNNNLYYQSANAKHIRIWGSNKPNTDYSTWILLGEWDDWRPSGLPPTTLNAGLTAEDLEAARAGNDFDFPLEIPGVRYIRIETVSTWEPRTQVYFPELEFWGRPTE